MLKNDLIKKFVKSKNHKANISDFKCNYDHSFNPFNMEHKLNGTMKLNNADLNFDLDFSSSLFSIYDFKKVDMKICAN